MDQLANLLSLWKEGKDLSEKMGIDVSGGQVAGAPVDQKTQLMLVTSKINNIFASIKTVEVIFHVVFMRTRWSTTNEADETLGQMVIHRDDFSKLPFKAPYNHAYYADYEARWFRENQNESLGTKWYDNWCYKSKKKLTSYCEKKTWTHYVGGVMPQSGSDVSTAYLVDVNGKLSQNCEDYVMPHDLYYDKPRCYHFAGEKGHTGEGCGRPCTTSESISRWLTERGIYSTVNPIYSHNIRIMCGSACTYSAKILC